MLYDVVTTSYILFILPVWCGCQPAWGREEVTSLTGPTSTWCRWYFHSNLRAM